MLMTQKSDSLKSMKIVKILVNCLLNCLRLAGCFVNDFKVKMIPALSGGDRGLHSNSGTRP